MMRVFLLLVVLLFAASALAIPPSLAQYTTTQAGTPGIFWTDTREGYSSYYLDNANEVPATYYDLIIYNCESFPVHNESQVWYINPPEWDTRDISRITNRVEILGLEGCMAQTVACEPTVPGDVTAPGMVACEQTLADVRDALTNPDGLETSPAPDSSISRSEAAFSTLTQQTTAKFNAADLPGKAADKFPFGYYELLASPQLSGTACELNSTGAGVGGLWRYCGSQYDTFLGGAIKTMMSGLVWISFALGVNARWAAAVT